jgi:hypothetical protein
MTHILDILFGTKNKYSKGGDVKNLEEITNHQEWESAMNKYEESEKAGNKDEMAKQANIIRSMTKHKKKKDN